MFLLLLIAKGTDTAAVHQYCAQRSQSNAGKTQMPVPYVHNELYCIAIHYIIPLMASFNCVEK